MFDTAAALCKVYLLSPPGTIFLWLFWPSFNGGLASGNAQVRAIINTYFSMTGSVIGTFLFSMVFDKNRKLSMVRHLMSCGYHVVTFAIQVSSVQ